MSARVLNAEASFHVRTTPTADPQVEVLDLHGRHVLFDANSLLAVEVSAETAAYVRERNAQPDAMPKLNGALFCRQQPQWPAFQPHPMKLVLLVTQRCNLACRYCFVSHGVQGSGFGVQERRADMPVETGVRALDLLRGEPDVAFFGGEPLLVWDTVAAIAEEAKRRSPKARLHVTTNGTLITPEIARAIRALGMSVLVSLDGPHDTHNAQRPLPNGDSFAATIEGLQRLKDAGCRAFLRATFDDPDADLADRFAFFADLIADHGLATGVSIEPAVLSEGCSTGVFGPGDETTLAARYHELAQAYVAQALQPAGRPTDFPPFRKMLERILYTRHAKSECGAGVGYLAVDPSGAIHACHKGGCPIGRLDYGIDEAARAPWSDNRLWLRAECRACWARYVCGGGCRHHRLALSGDVHGEAPGPCAVRKILVREALWILAELGPEKCREFIR